MSTISKKRSFLQTSWDGINYFFQSIINFFQKTFKGISDFIKSSPILFGLCALFLFFIEGAIYTMRGMVVESFFSKVYEKSNELYKKLKLDHLFEMIKKFKYNFLSAESKMKIQVEIFAYQIIQNFLNEQITQENGFYNFDYSDIESLNKSLKSSFQKNLNEIMTNQILDCDQNLEMISKISIEFKNNLMKIKDHNEIIVKDEKIQCSNKEALQGILLKNGFNQGKIRQDLSNLTLNIVKSKNEYNKGEFILDIIEKLNEKTNFIQKK